MLEKIFGKWAGIAAMVFIFAVGGAVACGFIDPTVGNGILIGLGVYAGVSKSVIGQ